MKKSIICIVCFLTFFQLQSQTIEGIVYDARTKETIPGVAIYLSGTSIITTSDSDGKFRLVVEKQINAPLIFSHLSYNTLTIEKPFEHHEKNFFLNEKINTLSEVMVVADRYSREDKMRIFKEQFLGKTTAGKSCVIINEEDMVLNYDHKTNSLVGFANKPIVIENKYLAYRIAFDLQNFTVQYSENTLDMNKARTVAFKGTSSFVDQSPYNIRFTKRREEIYFRSPQYFWRNFITNTLDISKFIIYNRLKQITPEQYFLISQIQSQRIVLVLPSTDINQRHPSVYEGTIYGVIRILCQNSYRSEVVFLTNRLLIDEFGNIDDIDKIVFFGDMGEQRIGEMLPRDYIYTPQKEAKTLR